MCGPSAAETSMPGTMKTPLSELSASSDPETVLWSVMATPTPSFLALLRALATVVGESEWLVWKCISTAVLPSLAMRSAVTRSRKITSVSLIRTYGTGTPMY
jgi:hypothetical protein